MEIKNILQTFFFGGGGGLGLSGWLTTFKYTQLLMYFHALSRAARI